MISALSKVVIIDDNIIDNTIYTVLEFAPDYNNKDTFYIIDGRKKIVVSSKQIRLATLVEIENGIKFDPITVKTVVAYVDLLRPNHLLTITEFNETTLMCVGVHCYTKESFTFNISEVRPARLKEREEGHRITIYNKEMYLSYFNPFMVYDLYNYNHPDELVYKERLEALNILSDNKLTSNGQRLHDDLDFDYMKLNMYDLNTININTNWIGTDRDGTVTEFKTNISSTPMYDDINGKWYIIKTPNEYVISKNKIVGMMKVNDYVNSLKNII